MCTLGGLGPWAPSGWPGGCSPFRRTLWSRMSKGPCSLSGFPTRTGRMSMPMAAAVCSSFGPKCFFACKHQQGDHSTGGELHSPERQGPSALLHCFPL